MGTQTNGAINLENREHNGQTDRRGIRVTSNLHHGPEHAERDDYKPQAGPWAKSGSAGTWLGQGRCPWDPRQRGALAGPVAAGGTVAHPTTEGVL